MVKEKIELVKFDIESYLDEGHKVIGTYGDMKALADEVYEQGFSNIVLIGIGGTIDEFETVRYLIERHSKIDVAVLNAAEYMVLGSTKIGPDTLVVTLSSSGNTKEIMQVAEDLAVKGVKLLAFTKKDTPLERAAGVSAIMPITKGFDELHYVQMFAFFFRLLNRRGEFDAYDDYLEQTQRIFEQLVDIRIQFEPRAQEIAEKYALAPYSMFIGSGALWGETVMYAMCMLEEMQWKRTRPISSPEFFHGTLELVEPGVPVFLFKGEDECRDLDDRVDRFLKSGVTKDEDIVVIDTAEFAVDGLDSQFRTIVSPLILTALASERMASHYETVTKHNLKYRRYYRQFDY